MDIDKNASREFTPVGSKKETKFLEGPHSRRRETIFLWEVLKEFIFGFRRLHFIGPCVTVFGSARFKEDHPYYQMARKVSGEIAKMGFTIMTGGGPGIMEAANRGAMEAGGISVGCNIQLMHEQKPNKYLHRWVTFDYFFVRKVLLTKYSFAFVVMPGGYGTMDEFFESITLIQTGKILRFPVVLMGTEFHKDLLEYIQNMQKNGTIDEADLQLFLFTDSIEDAVKHIDTYAVGSFGLNKKRMIRAMKILGERRLRAL
jgi:uncharacterized protein (TIGR00730 family)